ncbi:MAG: glycosyltransferase family 2 protein [Proteobacteria bacterium]|nr:glycosyltransferase family 2 protein [Pseudomonadota bacterium]
MTVVLFSILWNEERMLPFFFRHYDRWIDRYVMYDDRSTDVTLELLAAHPRVKIQHFSRAALDSFVLSALLLHDQVWKECRGNADLVVITAVDELLHHPDMAGYLARCKQADATAIPALGFQMAAPDFPSPGEWLAATRRRGAPLAQMNKLSIFDPDRIAETNYRPGRHWARPEGAVVIPAADEVVNLHYKYLGLAHVAQRHRLLATGLGLLDRAAQWGSQYDWSDAVLKAEWEAFLANAVDYTQRPPNGEGHPGRWWRPELGG